MYKRVRPQDFAITCVESGKRITMVKHRGGSLASIEVLDRVVDGAFDVLDAYFTDAQPQIGGSLASDAVLTLVQPAAWDRMNVWFTNRVDFLAGGGVMNGGGRGLRRSMYGGAGDCTMASALIEAVSGPGSTTGIIPTPAPAFPYGSSHRVYDAAASLPDMTYAAYTPTQMLPIPSDNAFRF